MTLKEYIESIKNDIDEIEIYEEKTGPLDCCDNRELEVLQYVLEALEMITDVNKIRLHLRLNSHPIRLFWYITIIFR